MTRALPAATRAVRRARADLRIRLNQLVELMSGRDDVLLDLVWDCPVGTPPAWFDPQVGQISVNADIALSGTDPDAVDPTTAAGRLAHPVLVGVTGHEGAHARCTRWHGAVTDDTPRAVWRAATLLEEPRIEHRHLQERPSDRVYLRAASRHILLSGPDGALSAAEDRWRAASAAALVLARVDAGVLEAGDVRAVEDAVTAALGASLVETLRGLWHEALDLADGDGAGLLDVADRWVTALEIDPDADPDAEGTRFAAASCAGQPSGEETGDPAEEDAASAGDADELGAVLGVILEAVSASGQAEAEAEAEEIRAEAEAEARRQAEAAAARARQHALKKAAREEAARVFGVGSGRDRDATSPISGTRPPALAEKCAASALTARLERARFRQRDVRTVPSMTPPGRVHLRSAMAQTAQRQLGLAVTATPYRRRVSTRTDQPTLSVGIGVDVSGSMRPVQEAVAAAAWIIAQAAGRTGGRAATVAFGSSVTPIVTPGLAPQLVTEFVADDATEDCVGAITALDGALDLASGRGARLLVLVTDGRFYGKGQQAGAERLVRRLTGCGAGVLQVALTVDGYRPIGGATVVEVDDPAAAVQAIAQGCVTALQAFQ